MFFRGMHLDCFLDVPEHIAITQCARLRVDVIIVMSAARAGMFALRERRIHVTQEDFEMAVTKVMKKDSDKDLSIKRLWT